MFWSHLDTSKEVQSWRINHSLHRYRANLPLSTPEFLRNWQIVVLNDCKYMYLYSGHTFAEVMAKKQEAIWHKQLPKRNANLSNIGLLAYKRQVSDSYRFTLKLYWNTKIIQSQTSFQFLNLFLNSIHRSWSPWVWSTSLVMISRLQNLQIVSIVLCHC